MRAPDLQDSSRHALLASTQPRDAPTSRAPRALWACLALGTLLRLIWPLDFEWKFDEKWMFRKALRVAQGLDPWPWVGMPSGVGTENPGASIWVFAALAYVANDPVAMTSLVALLNALVLWGLAFWVQRTGQRRIERSASVESPVRGVTAAGAVLAEDLGADLIPVLLLPCCGRTRGASTRSPRSVWGSVVRCSVRSTCPVLLRGRARDRHPDRGAQARALERVAVWVACSAHCRCRPG